jgi:hypothetical protein
MSAAAAMAPEALCACHTLPRLLLLDILARLPLNERLRAAEVCRTWRAACAERSFWTHLRVRDADNEDLHDAVLHGASAKAQGGVQYLDAQCAYASAEQVLAVAAVNAGALRELRMDRGSGADIMDDALLPVVSDVEAMLRAAPTLRVFRTHLRGEVEDVRRVLRKEGIFGCVSVEVLHVDAPAAAEDDDYDDALEDDPVDVPALAADVAAHPSLRALILGDISLADAASSNEVVAAVLSLRCRTVTLKRCGLSPASVPTLARLVAGGALALLSIINDGVRVLDAAGAELMSAALRASSTLTHFEWSHVDAWHDPRAALTLLGALTGHPSLQSLAMSGDRIPDADGATRLAAVEALCALVAANAALTHLSVPYWALGDEALRPLLDALQHNTRLRRVDFSGNRASEELLTDAFMRLPRWRRIRRHAVTAEPQAYPQWMIRMDILKLERKSDDEA